MCFVRLVIYHTCFKVTISKQLTQFVKFQVSERSIREYFGAHWHAQTSYVLTFFLSCAFYISLNIFEPFGWWWWKLDIFKAVWSCWNSFCNFIGTIWSDLYTIFSLWNVFKNIKRLLMENFAFIKLVWTNWVSDWVAKVLVYIVLNIFVEKCADFRETRNKEKAGLLIA